MRTQDSLQKVSTFSEFLPIVEKAEPRLSWFGERYVCINDTNQGLGIDSLASRMIDILSENPNFPEDQRPLIKKISDQIDRIYDKSDQQVANCWFFFRLIVWIRDLCNSQFPYHRFSSIRWNWRECKLWNDCGYKHIQFLYTKDQYQKAFGVPPKPREHPDKFDGYERWLAPSNELFVL